MTILSTRRKSVHFKNSNLTTTLSLSNNNPFISTNEDEYTKRDTSLKQKHSVTFVDQNLELESPKISPTGPNNILHETTFNKFNRTSSGKIYEKDFKDIFALLIISLCLKENSTGDSNINDSSSTFTKRFKLLPQITSSTSSTSSSKYPYTFQLSTAIQKMEDLNLSIESQKTITKISYTFKSDTAKNLIFKFYQAHFLHSPQDRTRKEPKNGVLLQPTPKGLQIVESFCVKIGLKNDKFPKVLNDACFNSMKLFNFERDLSTDKIIYSKSFLKILLIKLMGIKPNFWSPNNKPDLMLNKVANLESKSNNNNDQKFEDDVFTQKFLKPITPTDLNDNELTPKNSSTSSSSTLSPESVIGGFSFTKYQENKDLEESNASVTSKPNTTTSIKTQSTTSSTSLISPFYHKYFSNPESDSHIQYYVSTVGVRLIKNKIIEDPSTKNKKSLVLDYCINGKAMLQWLMDCTDLIQEKHALEIANLFLKENFLKAIIVNDQQLGTLDSSISFHKENYYRLTEKGLSICSWGKSSSSLPIVNQASTTNGILPKKINSTQKQNITLDSILKDPALKFQFKNHLIKEFCVENFDAYCQLENFNKKLKIYKDLKNLSKINEDEDIFNTNVSKKCSNQKNICMSLAYQIFNIFINSESSYMININYKLRSKIINLLIDNNFNSNENEIKETDSILCLKTPIDEFKKFDESKFEEEQEQEQVETDTSDKVLEELENLFNQVKDHLYTLMNIDSLPKFLNNLN
ncbi:SST2 [Candida pseudojiufengensis]|uniref:SST2 n=1 Tax=Candida pseudojiufengensis TaxID=497109 RepID=UPI002224C3C1|nr:SST2 [Candida pseudojiufengensis]KAI5964353.1 SST2 [Candida pseudojiufengensis]